MTTPTQNQTYMSMNKDNTLHNDTTVRKGSGVFDACGNAPVVVNENGENESFAVTVGEPLFNDVLHDESLDVVGTEGSNKYLPGNLPLYIPTLYKNAQLVNKNLINEMTVGSGVSVENDRKYPTCFAVKNYVQEQLTGSEIIELHNSPADNVRQVKNDDDTVVLGLYGEVSTSLNNSLLKATKTAENVQLPLETSEDNKERYVYEMKGIATADEGRSKNVINVVPSTNESTTLNTTTEVWCNSNCVFMVLGEAYNTYQYGFYGESLEMIQFIANKGTTEEKGVFIVNNYKGFFYNRA